jgi:predicted RNase H-like HicB family nuclease
MAFRIIIEPTKKGFSAYCPDVPGFISTGKTMAETKEKVPDALAYHLEGLAMSIAKEMELERNRRS